MPNLQERQRLTIRRSDHGGYHLERQVKMHFIIWSIVLILGISDTDSGDANDKQAYRFYFCFYIQKTIELFKLFYYYLYVEFIYLNIQKFCNFVFEGSGLRMPKMGVPGVTSKQTSGLTIVFVMLCSTPVFGLVNVKENFEKENGLIWLIRR